mmetsp:Transcript_56229/g.117577  ORF Transcript_56229/g.117577 Transcript_56229/m.117577 type:complete len:110 (-) Transcript_56229:59-388(-)
MAHCIHSCLLVNMLQLICDEKSIGANRNRRTAAHHGSSSVMAECHVCAQTFLLRLKRNRLNRLYSMRAHILVGANGYRRISAHHGSSSPTISWWARHAIQTFEWLVSIS